jgi:chromosome segregation ATPase
VVEAKPKVVKPEVAEAKAADKLARLRAAAARAEAAVLPAEAHAIAAKRRVERAQQAREDLASHTFDHALAGAKVPLPKSGQPDEAYEAHNRTHDELVAEREALDARLARLRAERNVADEAADDARDAAELARNAVAEEERSRAAVAQAAERAAERAAQWAAQEEEWGREREESQARLAAARANVAAAEARLSSLKRELSPACCPSVAAPKVFKLTGMSAAAVGSMASQVSQESIGALYWDESAWDGYNRAVRREYGSD